MIDPKMIDDLARRLSGSLPEGLRSLRTELEQNMRPVLQSALGKLDLVTREEFDVQSEVLARARLQLDQLEQTVAELRTRLENQSN
ncbi:MAG: accessory factor UbiK family protein [Gammaproteobacteria bacterium]|nr:accessory factor UbiK family protein [Gammaproteobacteria bacterium]NND60821.1 accessory factor UbiK family protein [Gammaproteobacteria bacterium]